MKFLLPLIAVFAFVLVGCTHTEKVVTKHVAFQIGTNRLEIENPQDTAWEDLQITHGDSSIRIKKYRSSANEAAIAAKEQEIQGQTQMFGLYMQMAERVGVRTAQAFGVPVPSLPPAPTQQTNPVIVFQK